MKEHGSTKRIAALIACVVAIVLFVGGTGCLQAMAVENSDLKTMFQGDGSEPQHDVVNEPVEGEATVPNADDATVHEDAGNNVVADDGADNVVDNDANDGAVNDDTAKTDTAADANVKAVDEGANTDPSAEPEKKRVTMTYDANGGYFGDDVNKTTNEVVYEYDAQASVKRVSHTKNLDDEGVGPNGYGDNVNFTEVISIPGTNKLNIDITYQTESSRYDWVCIWEGDHPTHTASNNFASSLSGKLAGNTKTSRQFEVSGDAVTIAFRSDGSNHSYYGYYAVITSKGSYNDVDDTYTIPSHVNNDMYFAGWNTKADGSGTAYADEYRSDADSTLYAMWKQKSVAGDVYWWIKDGTLFLAPTNSVSGVLKKMNNGSTGAPWYGKRGSIENINVQGSVAFGKDSSYLFADCYNLRDISGLSNVNVSRVENMQNMFYNYQYADGNSFRYDFITTLEPLSSWDVSNVTNMSQMFYGRNRIKNLSGLESWDTSNVTNMSSMFAGYKYGTTSYGSLEDISALADWNVGNVTNMSSMFAYCDKLTDIKPLSKWDTSNVIAMGSMFSYNSALTSLQGLEHWDTGNVTDMGSMFNSCSKLNDIAALITWNTSHVTSMGSMFAYCGKLADIAALADWNVSSVTTMGSMFLNDSALTSLQGLLKWDTGEVTNMSQMFDGCSSLTSLHGLNSWDVGKVTTMNYMFYNCSKLIDISALLKWNTDNVTSMYDMFCKCSSLPMLHGLEDWNTGNVTDMRDLFLGCSKLTDISALASWDTSNVNSASSMFQDCTSLPSLNGLEYWNVSKVTSLQNMFFNCQKLSDITALADWDTSNVTDMSSMFYRCYALGRLDALIAWNVAKVTNMYAMFQDCSSLLSLDGLEDWDTGKVTSVLYMFRGCSQLSDISALLGWDTSNVTTMEYLFSGDSSIESLHGLEGWNVAKVTNLSYAFNGLSKIDDLTYLSDWNTASVHTLVATFQGCSSLTSLDGLEHWNVSKIGTASYIYSYNSDYNYYYQTNGYNNQVDYYYNDFAAMFKDCSKLSDISALLNWNTSKVRYAQYMFSGTAIVDVGALSAWNTSSIITMSRMFSSCKQLSDIAGLTKWNTAKVESFNSMFYNDTVLVDLKPLWNWNTSNALYMNSMFQNTGIETLKYLEHWNVSKVRVMQYMFNGCVNLHDAGDIGNWNYAGIISQSLSINRTVSGTTYAYPYTAQYNFCSMFLDSGVTNSRIQRIAVPSVDNNGAKFVRGAYYQYGAVPDSAGAGTTYSPYNSNNSQLYANYNLGERIISEDGTRGPMTWDELYQDMTTNPDDYRQSIVWVRYVPSWITQYESNGGVGSMPATFTAVENKNVLPQASFIRFGYTFAGWTTQPDPVSDVNPLMKAGSEFRPEDAADGKKVTLYAQWTKNDDADNQPLTGTSGMLPGWVQIDSSGTTGVIPPAGQAVASFTNKYAPGSTSLTLRFTKLVDGKTPEDSYSFELTNSTGNLVEKVSNAGSAIAFAPLTFDKEGTYVYYVRETRGQDETMDYDSHVIQVTVDVTADKDDPAKLKATAQVIGSTIFDNESKPATLDIAKHVTGTDDKSRDFTFDVKLMDADAKPVEGLFALNVAGGDTSVNQHIEFKAGVGRVAIKAGQTASIVNLPAHSSYVVTERDIPQGYTLGEFENGNGVLNAAAHVSVNATNIYTVSSAMAQLGVAKRLLDINGKDTVMDKDQFRFVVCEVAPDDAGNETCAGAGEASVSRDGKAVFEPFVYDKVGTYTYRIKEIVGDDPDIRYDSTVVTAIVSITDDGKGALHASVKYQDAVNGIDEASGLPQIVNHTTVSILMPKTGETWYVLVGIASIVTLVLLGMYLAARKVWRMA